MGILRCLCTLAMYSLSIFQRNIHLRHGILIVYSINQYISLFVSHSFNDLINNARLLAKKESLGIEAHVLRLY